MEFNKIYQKLISGSEKLALVGLGYVGMVDEESYHVYGICGA